MSWPKRLAWPGGTLYNQFASKEEIFREMLLRVSSQLEDAFPPGIESQGNVDVLRLVAQKSAELMVKVNKALACVMTPAAQQNRAP
jgi:AcrR family transcriptional regulator